MALACHPERSEGSVALCIEMLRCTQHDTFPFASKAKHLCPTSQILHFVQNDTGRELGSLLLYPFPGF
jgi:hypothetical protein